MNHIEPSGKTALQISRNSLEHLIWLTNNHMIGKSEQGVRLTAGVRSSDHRAFPQLSSAREDVEDIGLLDVHPADHDQVGPQDVRIEEFVKGLVGEPYGPILRTQSG